MRRKTLFCSCVLRWRTVTDWVGSDTTSLKTTAVLTGTVFGLRILAPQWLKQRLNWTWWKSVEVQTTELHFRSFFFRSSSQRHHRHCVLSVHKGCQKGFMFVKGCSCMKGYCDIWEHFYDVCTCGSLSLTLSYKLYGVKFGPRKGQVVVTREEIKLQPKLVGLKENKKQFRIYIVEVFALLAADEPFESVFSFTVFYSCHMHPTPTHIKIQPDGKILTLRKNKARNVKHRSFCSIQQTLGFAEKMVHVARRSRLNDIISGTMVSMYSSI